MKTLLIATVVVCTISVLGAQGTDYQKGKIVAVEKISKTVSSGTVEPQTTPDAPPPENRQAIKLTIELGGNTYVCRAETDTELELEWAKGKEVPAKVKGNTMKLKRANGKVVTLPIIEKN